MTSEQLKTITDKLKDKFGDDVVSNDISKLFTSPVGLIIVMYNGSSYNDSNNIPLTSRLRIKRFSVNVLVRDPMSEDIVMDYIDKIITTLQGLKLGGLNDYERLMPVSDAFEQYTDDNSVYGYKVDFVLTEISNTSSENV